MKRTVTLFASALLLALLGINSCGEVEFNLPDNIKKFSIDEEEVYIIVGETYRPAYTVKPEDADLSWLVWESLNDTIATVSQDGAVTGVAAGRAGITVSDSLGNLIARCTAVVMDGPQVHTGGSGISGIGQVQLSGWMSFPQHSFDPSSITEYGYVYGKDPDMLEYGSAEKVSQPCHFESNGSVLAIPYLLFQLENLDYGATYYYRGFMLIAGKPLYGDIESFTMHPALTECTIESTTFQAYLKAEIWLYNPSFDSMKAGFRLSNLTNGETYDIEGEIYAPDRLLQAYGVVLEPGSTYEIYAYAIQNGEEYRGPVTTLENPEPQFDVTLSPGPQKTPFDLSITTTVTSSNASGSIYVTLRYSDTESSLEGLLANGISYRLPSYVPCERTHDLIVAPGRTYHFVSVVTLENEKYDKYEFFSDIISFTTPSVDESVDLGTGVLWRSWNLGASEPQEFGEYFAWGETAPKTEFSWSSYSFANDDAAAVLLGEGWRIPTPDEFFLLQRCTDIYQGIIDGTVCFRLRSRIEGYEDKAILFPAAGWINNNGPLSVNKTCAYWASEIKDPQNAYAYTASADNSNLYSYSVGSNSAATFSRCYGLPIRPVRDK